MHHFATALFAGIIGHCRCWRYRVHAYPCGGREDVRALTRLH